MSYNWSDQYEIKKYKKIITNEDKTESLEILVDSVEFEDDGTKLKFMAGVNDEDIAYVSSEVDEFGQGFTLYGKEEIKAFINGLRFIADTLEAKPAESE